MIGRTNAGGTGIKFKVIGGAEKPETGRENLVFVKTETAITGWVVSQKEPENLTDGMVWIKSYGKSNKINLLRKNSVEVFLSNCSQRIDGKMKNVEAYLWKDNAWVQFSSERIYLIKDGKMVDGVTFTSISKQWSSGARISPMVVSTTSAGVKFISGDQLDFGGVTSSCQTPAYDITAMNRLFCSVAEKTADYFVMGFGNPTYTFYLDPKITLNVGANQSLDISQLTGVQSFTITKHSYGKHYAIVTDLWLE